MISALLFMVACWMLYQITQSASRSKDVTQPPLRNYPGRKYEPRSEREQQAFRSRPFQSRPFQYPPPPEWTVPRGLKVAVSEKYSHHRQKLRESLNIIADCGMAAEFKSLLHTIQIRDTDICNLGRSKHSYVMGHTDRDGEVTLCPCTMELHSAVNVSFALLHEYWHNKLKTLGKSTLNMAEERACDRFAHDTLSQRGYLHTVTTAYSGQMNLIVHTHEGQHIDGIRR